MKLNNNELQIIANLLYNIFLEIRTLKDINQAVALADLAHNIPLHMFREDFNIWFVIEHLKHYRAIGYEESANKYFNMILKIIPKGLD